MAGEISLSPALSDALVILGSAGIVIPVFARLRITPVIGFILIGLLVGPYGLGSWVYEYPWLTHVDHLRPRGSGALCRIWDHPTALYNWSRTIVQPVVEA